MFSALVGVKKCIRPQKYCTSYYLMELHTFPPLLSPPAVPFSCLRRKWWNGVKEDVKCFGLS